MPIILTEGTSVAVNDLSPHWNAGSAFKAFALNPNLVNLSFSLYGYGLVIAMLSYACSGLYHW
jgi:hypothetical protein